MAASRVYTRFGFCLLVVLDKKGNITCIRCLSHCIAFIHYSLWKAAGHLCKCTVDSPTSPGNAVCMAFNIPQTLISSSPDQAHTARCWQNLSCCQTEVCNLNGKRMKPTDRRLSSGLSLGWGEGVQMDKNLDTGESHSCTWETSPRQRESVLPPWGGALWISLLQTVRHHLLLTMGPDACYHFPQPDLCTKHDPTQPLQEQTFKWHIFSPSETDRH